MGNACLVRNGFGGLFIISGEHHHIQMKILHSFHRRCGIRLQHIRRRNGTQIFSLLTGKMQRCLSLPGQIRQFRNDNSQFLHQTAVAAIITNAFDGACHTSTGQGFKVRGFGIGILSHFLQNCLGKGMLGLAFQRSRNPHQPAESGAAGQNIRHFRLSGGEGSGLIQHHGIHMMEIFQCLRVLEQNTHLGAPSGSYHNGHRRCQAQCTGTGNHQHGNTAVQREFQSKSSNHPNKKCNHRNGHHDRYKYARDFVSQTGNGCLGAAGLFHHADDLSQSGIFTDLVCPEFQIAFRIDGGGCHRIPTDLLYGNTFTRKGTLVHGGSAGKHCAIHRNAAAGAHNHRISHPDLFHRDFHVQIVSANGGGFGTQIHQRPDGITGAALSPGFQKFTQRNQGQNHGCRFKVQVLSVHFHQCPVPMSNAVRHTEQRHHTVDQRGNGSHRNQRIHVGCLVPKGFQSPAVIDPV